MEENPTKKFECEHCGDTEIKKFTSKYGEFHYCSIYCGYEKFIECKHEKVELVQYKIDKGYIQIREFCKKCGELGNQSISKKNVPNYQNLKVVDSKFKQSISTGSQWYNNLSSRYRQKAYHYHKEENTKAYRNYLKSEEWKERRKLVLKRDNYLCQACLKNKATQVHHLDYETLFNENCFRLISVCKPCHVAIHADDEARHQYYSDLEFGQE